MRRVQDADLKGKKVLLRADLNVPIDGSGNVLDATKIIRLIPTIRYLVEKGAKIILASHLGRPGGRVNTDFSTAQLLPILRQHYKVSIDFCADYKDAKEWLLVDGEVLLLENLRFYPEEEGNDDIWANSLAQIAEIYVNDAFACCHRAHASIVAVTRYLPSYAGLLLQEEVESLQRGLGVALRPAVAIVGGKKVSSKYKVLQSLLSQMDCVLLAGGMANTFLAAMGYNMGKSFVESDVIVQVKKLIHEVEKGRLLLPVDFTVMNKNGSKVVDLGDISADDVIGDIGPNTLFHWCEVIRQSKTVLWNGPLGIYEDSRFSAGSNMLARFIAKRTANKDLYSIVGGGDVVAVVQNNGLSNSFSYVSTAGGAFLEWLEGSELPGIKALFVKEGS